MEGLLPLVYKAIKKNRTRRQYQCLSSGDALSYNISMAEIYPQTQGHVYDYQPPPTQRVVDHGAHRVGHRRHKTVGDFANGWFQSPPRRTGASSPPSKQLARFRSHRMFSCITGV